MIWQWLSDGFVILYQSCIMHSNLNQFKHAAKSVIHLQKKPIVQNFKKNRLFKLSYLSITEQNLTTIIGCIIKAWHYQLLLVGN